MDEDTLILLERGYDKYPYWTDQVLYPDLERNGPNQYDISAIELWHWQDHIRPLRFGQYVCESVDADLIHTFLYRKNILQYCLSVFDLLAIQKKGIEFYRKHFQGKRLYAWKSLCSDPQMREYAAVPFLVETDKGTLFIGRTGADVGSLNKSDASGRFKIGVYKTHDIY